MGSLFWSRATANLTYIHSLTSRLAIAAAQGRDVFSYRQRDIAAAEFLASIYRYARALSMMGVRRGSVVALLAPNSPDAIAVRYATNLLGAAACYLSAPPSAEARALLIQQIDPSLLVAFPATLHLLPAGLGVKAVTVGDCGSSLPRLDQLASAQSDEVLDCEAQPEELAVIVSSGGSTGVPKGSWRNFATYTRMVETTSSPDRRQLVNGPLAYLSQVLVDVTLLGGGCVVLEDAFDVVDTLAQIRAQRITDLFLVEPQLFELMDHPAVEMADLSSLRSLVHVGASAPATLRRRAQERFGPVVAHVYGASEVGIVSLAGRVVPGVEVRFRKSDGSLAGADEQEPGLIEVRSPALAQGYRNRPDLTESVFKEGWYQSADLGCRDDKGYLHVLGRADDIANDGSRLITPTELEDTLCRLPSVRYAVVVADRERKTRVAVVVPWPHSTLDGSECLRSIATAFGSDVAGSLVLVPVDRVALTEQGKPDRQVIKRLGALL
jgi:fatty-acyl-CoA synthase